MNVNEIKIGMQIRVISDEGTKGMLISPEILSRRQVGKTGTIKGYVSGHGGDVWFVEQDDGIAAYCFTELAVRRTTIAERIAHHAKKLWSNFMKITFEESLWILIGGAIFTFGTLGVFWLTLNIDWFAGIVGAVTLFFIYMIARQKMVGGEQSRRTLLPNVPAHSRHENKI